ncbi:MAG TPA: hypothetical protein VMU90_02415 [Solirubrobacteraceae bacterium]|nr:hypothetical protein [Solirubrobacteraceae bacterium]
MSIRSIRTEGPDLHSSCDVCGRTMLRGERPHSFLEGTELRSVCELCTQRATQEGWIREGTMPVYEGRGSRTDNRGSVLGRLRRRRGASDYHTPGPVSPEAREGNSLPAHAPAPDTFRGEPRHVRAVPTGDEQKVSAGIDAFNHSEHTRTIAGVARSLGLPTVSVRPAQGRTGAVNIVVAWELSWYRYEVDLAEEVEPVQIAAQGAELDELSPQELEPNAACDADGYLAVA